MSDVELTISSRVHPTPYSLIPLPSSRFQEDLRYDVIVEMELVRPHKLAEETGTLPLHIVLYLHSYTR